MTVQEMIAKAESNYNQFNVTGPALDPARTTCFARWKLVTIRDTKGNVINQYDFS